MRNDRVRRLITRTIEGVEALVNTESGEIFMDIPAENPQYIRVEEGDTVQEGDIRSRKKRELESPSLRKWTIETIGQEIVVGTDRETGARHEWDRESLETKLAIGELSTNLTSFDRVNVISRSDDPNHEERSDEESGTVMVYGNDGQKFTLTYRLVDDDAGGEERHVELTTPDERLNALEPDVRERFDRAVEHALRDEGYAV